MRYIVRCNHYPYLPLDAVCREARAPYVYRYEIIFSGKSSYDSFIRRLRMENFDYFPSIERRDDWWVKWVEPRESDSITSVWFWRFLQLAFLAGVSIFSPIYSGATFLRRLCLRLLTIP